MTVKWDGAQQLYVNKSKNGKFFVGTKSVFNVTPKINYTTRDIAKNHSEVVADKLKFVWSIYQD